MNLIEIKVQNKLLLSKLVTYVYSNKQRSIKFTLWKFSFIINHAAMGRARFSIYPWFIIIVIFFRR